MKKFLIVGTGHSGTTYLTQLLCALEIVTGHETRYSINTMTGVLTMNQLRSGGRFPDWNDLDGDVSWLGVPWLQDHEGPIVHVVRDPRKVIASIHGGASWLLPSGSWRKAVEGYAPEIFASPFRLNQISTFWRLWMQRAEEYSLDTQRIEDLDVGRLLKVIGHPRSKAEIARALERIPTNTNHRYESAPLTWDDLPPDIHTTAQGFGYE